jgi:hypothetical protein
MDTILDDAHLSSDLFELPDDALTHIFSSSETCVGELKLFKTLQNQIDHLAAEDPDSPQIEFLKNTANKYIRISQLDVKTLVTEIKGSGLFEDATLFQAIQFNVAREVLGSETLLLDLRFIQRGLLTCFDFKHFDLSIVAGEDPREMHASQNNFFFRIKRDKICQSTDESCLSAIMSEALPFHGIHYWEFKIKASPRAAEGPPEVENVGKSDESKSFKDIENTSGLQLGPPQHPQVP